MTTTTESAKIIEPPAPGENAKGIAWHDFSMSIALVAIWAFFFWRDPAFLGSRNLSNLAVELSITAVLSLGMLLIIVASHIDLSIGSGLGLFGGMVAVLIFKHNWPAPLAMSATLVVAILIWLLMGTLIVKERIPAFIITLAGLLIFKGLHWLVIKSETVPIQVGDAANAASLLTTWFFPGWLGWVMAAGTWAAIVVATIRSRMQRAQFGFPLEPRETAIGKVIIGGQMLILFVLVCNQYRGIPLSAVILAAAAFAIWVLTQHTRFGRYLYAIGGNEEAALVSGVPVHLVTIGAFGIMGILVAIGGFMQTAYAGSSTTTIGALAELDAIAACVIGGTSLRGGRGTVLGVIFGSLIMASLLNGMTLLAVSPEAKFIARGAVLALAVWADVRLRKGR